MFLCARAWYGTKRDLAHSFALFQALIFIWIVFEIIYWEVPSFEAKREALQLEFVGIAFIPGAFYIVARSLEKKSVRGPKILLTLSPGIAILVLVFTNDIHHFFWRDNLRFSDDGEYGAGWAFWVFLAYAYIHLTVAFVKLAKVAHRSRGLFARWMWLVTAIFGLSFATNAVYYIFLLGRPFFDPTPISFALSGLLMAWTLRRFDLFDTIPYAKNVVLESIDTSIIAVDAEGLIIGTNEEAKRLFPNPDAIDGRPISEIVPELAGAVSDGVPRKWAFGGIEYLISCYAIKDGRKLGQGSIFLFRDVSALAKAQRELESARDRADSANQAKSAFVATVSHELRNPLNAIIGLAEINLRTSPPSEIREDFEVILSSGNILLGLVNDLLDLSKIEAGKMDLESIDFDLHEKTVSVLRAFRPTAEKKGIFLDLVIEEGTPRYVKGDPLRYGQVLMNLVSNAVKFTEHGAVTVDIAPVALPEGAGEDGDSRTIAILSSVRDSGMGIAADKLPLLFHEFTQADPSVSRRFGGTGLGLSICKKLVELFGGEIDASSIEGSGSTFSFTARFKPGQAVASSQETCPDAACPEKLRVLVVDDDPINNAVAKRYIEKLGHEVTCATTGKEAVDLAATGNFDIALLDLGLTDMDGYEACRRIRMATSARPDGELPVAAMTARVESGVRAACAAAGMITCLPKPLVPSALDELFERIGAKLRQLGPRASATVQAPGISVAEMSKAPRPEAPGTPLINMSALLERLDEDKAFMLELLGIFVDEAPGRRASFEAAKAERNLEALQKQSHALKGSALSLCANPIGAEAGALEAACIAARQSGFVAEPLFLPIFYTLSEVERLLEDTAAEAAAIIARSRA